MHKVLKIILFLFFCLCNTGLLAQKKYAVIIGVDDYFDAPGVKSRSSLSGCVNDGKAIKALLENRFGFEPANIYTLFNAAATKKNVIARMRSVYQQSKAGDAVVFYFSGHGVWMTNKSLDRDPVKRGMSQSIVFSDLYSPGWECLMQDESLKDIFNQFVDKKIIFTSIFDCCYSATLAMLTSPPKYWSGWLDYLREESRHIELWDIPYVPVLTTPKGCVYNTAGVVQDSTDSDGDSVPDCKDWEINTLPGFEVDSNGATISQYMPPGFAFWNFKPNDQTGMADDTSSFINGDQTRAFRLKDALFVSNKSSTRPSERPNSAFLSLAATADNLKGLEIGDIAGTRHGAFTAALLEVYKTNQPGIPVSVLVDKINSLMKKQSYKQAPTHFYEASRLKGNLIGTGTAGFSNKLKLKCKMIRNGSIIFDKGLHDGLAKGNNVSAVISGSTVSLRLSEVFADSAIAKDNSNGKIRPGQVFELADVYTISTPLLKLYIPSTKISAAEYDVFFKSKILQLANKDNYLDYFFGDTSDLSNIIFWDDTKRFRSHEHMISPDPENPNRFSVFLPTPSFISDAIRSTFSRDQNIQLVSDEKSADLVLYLNYARKKPGKKSGFVFFFHPRIDYNGGPSYGESLFSKAHVLLPTINASTKDLKALAQSLYSQVKGLIRTKTNNWINDHPRR